MELHAYTTNSQWIASLTVARISSILSILGSSAILYMILSKYKKKLQHRHNRLLVGACIFDLFYSSGLTVSTAAIPSDTVSLYPIYGAMGNMTTCKIQGFFIQMGVGTFLYLACLSLHFVLVIRYQIDEDLISKKIEPWMHSISILVPLSTAIIALRLDLYHYMYTVCWIAGKPWDRTSKPYVEFILGYMWYAFALLVQCICMLLVYRTVRHREIVMNSLGLRGRDGRLLVKSSSQISVERRDTGIQALLTISATLFTLSWPLASSIMANIGIQASPPLLYTINFFAPLLGFLNFIVYIRPRYMNIKRRYPRQHFWLNLKMALLNIEPNHRGSTVLAVPIGRRKSICNTQIENSSGLDASGSDAI